ncbi:MAG: hypothetical protein Q8922_06705 [Bacteroidota bacterium]|nr:hypothetical protein [Bacteroidota bacterium]
MTARRTWLSSLLALVTFVTSASAQQYVWRVKHSDRIGSEFYSPSAIDCYGPTCTVAALRLTYPSGLLRLVFLRSDDNGETWTEQDPGPAMPDLHFSGDVIVALQQIDSLNAIAVGGNTGGFGSDSVSSIILRTRDGGNTWIRQFDTWSSSPSSVSFTNSELGLVTHWGLGQVATTTDGGDHWDSIPAQLPVGGAQSAAMSTDSFVVFNLLTQKTYSTHNRWRSIDSTLPLVRPSTDSQSDEIDYFNFTGRDTIICYGTSLHGSNRVFTSDSNLVMRSTDAGRSWAELKMPPFPNDLGTMTTLKRDTVFAAGLAGVNVGAVLMSTDRGASWRTDTMVVDTNYNPTHSMGLSVTGDGHVIGLFTYDHVVGVGAPGVILRRERIGEAGISSGIHISSRLSLFPNPFSQSTTISFTPETSGYADISIVNLLGVNVARLFSGELTAVEHTFTWNPAGLPDGMYECLVRMNGRVVCRCKLLVSP